MSIMNKILYHIVLAVFTLFSWLPLKVHYVVSDILFFLFYKVLRYRFTTVVTNISRSFPDMDYKEVKKLTEGFYHSLCDTVVETVWAYTRSRERASNRPYIKHKGE